MQELWRPSSEQIQQANLTRFIKTINEDYRLSLLAYEDLYNWSIENIEDFWAAVWKFSDVIYAQNYKQVLRQGEEMLDCQWFEGARLNFAENLLRYRDEHTAIMFKREKHPLKAISYAELYRQVARLASVLRRQGIGAGDRVAAYLPNMPEAIIAMLATASIGAIWSSCSTDFGVKGVVDRFGQIEPRILFCVDGYSYNGREFDILQRVKQIKEQVPSLEKIVLVPYLRDAPDLACLEAAAIWSDLLEQVEEQELAFTPLSFDHPLYIMYSSGTTGVPKCMVHGAGGTLLQHLKELSLHTDLKRSDILFYFTTCGWMMWNWLVSGLAVGATLFLYDGSPFYPHPGVLMQMAAEQKITVFGTSAKYLMSLEKEGVRPGREYDLLHLRAILSTGSPLPPESFHYVYQHIKDNLLLSSISGGTDIISCFALGNPIGPVYAGELQCRGLGMKVEAYSENGYSLIDEKGELVCTRPFPSMPVFYWNDPERRKYRQAYFERFPGVWCHGDFIEIKPSGGIIIHGRSDATLNPGGVRIGTAEIYRQTETFPEIADSLAVGQSWHNDVRVILFVKLVPSRQLDESLIARIKQKIKQNTSPHHVPARVIQVADIPYTLNGKKVEIAVKQVIEKQPVLNRDALINPEALDYYLDLAELEI